MASIKFKLSNNSAFSNNAAAVLIGKNGFQTTFGAVPLLANTVSVVDSDPANRPNGNIEFTVVGFDQLWDYNFNKHLLAVNDVAFKANNVVKGDDYVTIPVVDKTTDIVPPNFVGAQSVITDLSYNIAGYDISLNTIKVVNEHAGAFTLASRLPEPPFYVTLPQLIDKDHLKGVTTSSTSRTGWRPNTTEAGNVYIKGSTRTLVLENNVSTLTGEQSLPLGIEVKNIAFLKFYVDGIERTTDVVDNFPSKTVSYDFGSVAGAQQRVRTEATYYTIPAIERGDNITLFTGNTYAVSNVSYDSANTYGDYNARITANTVYRITLKDDLRANVGGRAITNITNDPQGTIGNVLVGPNTVTFDYNSATYPGNWNLANNQIYQLGTSLEFEEYFFGQTQRRFIPNVPFGLNSVRARNKNTQGRLSAYTTHSLFIRQIPIQKVENLTVTESLYLDTTRGIATRATISFDDIVNQGVTDYELSYKVSGTQIIGGVEQMTPLTSFNTVKINRTGAESGVLRYTIQNLDRAYSGSGTPFTLLVRVTPLNRQLRGISNEIEQIIVGKTAAPRHITSFIVGQNDNSLVFNWSYPTDPITGILLDLDLAHVEIRRSGSSIDTDDQDALKTAFNISPQVAEASPPTTNFVIPIPNYGLSTYIIQTVDTSGNRSERVTGFQFEAIRPPNLQVYKAYSEGNPKVAFAKNSIGENITNSNYDEYHWPSFANTRHEGLVYGYPIVAAGSYSTAVDNANGAASGWSTTTDVDDLYATDVAAEYITQIRDVGANVTGKIVMNVFADVTTTDVWTGSRVGDAIFSGTSEVQKGRPGIPGANVLIDKAVITNQPGDKGIGHYFLNNIISSAETVAFDNFITKSVTSNSTDIGGTVSTLIGARTFTGNVYAIWNEGQFAGDTSNANSFALIANVINSVAIELGNTYTVRSVPSEGIGSRYQITANALPNVTQNASTYKIVNLSQFFDVPNQGFQGDPGVITQNVDFRFSTQNVWLGINDTFKHGSNGNVKTNSFVNYNVASGFMTVQTADEKFRWFQVRLKVQNRVPESNDFLLDELNYTVDLQDKKFVQTKIFTPTKGPTVNFNDDGIGFNYRATDFKTPPLVTVTISNTRVGLLAVVSNVTNTSANINLYFAANGAVVGDENYPGKRGISPPAGNNLAKVTIEATGI